MRYLLTVLAYSLSSVAAVAATPTESLDAFHEAIRTGDKAQAALILKSDVIIYESGYVERSRDEYLGHHFGSDGEFARATTSKVLHQSERATGELAVVMRETATTGKFKGKAVHMLGTETAVLEKQGEGWILTHLHWSSRKAK